MNKNDFLKSLAEDNPDSNYSQLLVALWWDKKGDWDRAHSIAQDVPTGEGSWVHAYLHRVEGDEWNASYWYNRANKKVPEASLEEEWNTLVDFFLEQ